MSETAKIILFFGLYLLLLPLIILAVSEGDNSTVVKLIIAFVWWLFCFPGYILIWSVIEQLSDGR